jgi:hypothetical protein
MSKNKSYSEIVVLLQRIEGDDRNRQTVDEDLCRLLLMSKDARQRDDMIEVQATRKVTNIFKKCAVVSTQKLCAA